MPYVDGLFVFDLTAEQLIRNDELKTAYEKAFVSVGGLVLPVSTVIPKQRRNEIRSRSWVTRNLVGLKDIKRTTRINSDGSTTVIVEKSFYRADGTFVREITETTQEDDTVSSLFHGTNPYLTLNELFNAVSTLKRGSSTITINEHTPKQFPREIRRTTITNPPDSQIETTQVETKTFEASPPAESGEDYALKTIHTKQETYLSEPKVFADPVVLTSITGKQFVQYIRPAGPDAEEDKTWWSDEMRSTPLPSQPTQAGQADAGSTSDIIEDLTINPQGNKITRKTIQTDVDPDGNRKVTTSFIEEPYIDPLEELRRKYSEESSSTTVRNVEGLVEGTVVETFNIDGEKLSVQTTTVTRQPSVRVTTSIDEDLVENTITTRTSEVSIDEDGVETVTDVELTEKTGLTRRITYTTSIDYDARKKSISFTRETTNSDPDVIAVQGEIVTEDMNITISLDTPIKTLEETLEQYQDDQVEEVVYGHMVTEFEISGEVLENEYVQPIMDKYLQHQTAWGMFNLLSQQLDLGDKISPDLRKTLHQDQAAIFTGTLNEDSPSPNRYRSGFVLDRMSLEVFNERYHVGCVFAENDGFRVQWIAGTDRIYSWTMRLQIYHNLVEGTNVVTSGGWEDLGDPGRFRSLYGDYTRLPSL